MAYFTRYCDGSPQIKKEIGQTTISYNNGFSSKYLTIISHPYVFNKMVMTEKTFCYNSTINFKHQLITTYRTTLYNNKKPQNYSSVLK
jgi:hypothetical protein